MMQVERCIGPARPDMSAVEHEVAQITLPSPGKAKTGEHIYNKYQQFDQLLS
jgi:hypothetical protein